jgi:predicted dehydrogenase
MTSSRRRFLKTTAAAGAAAALTPAGLPAAAYRRVIGAAERVRIGVIGPGGMGSGHVGSFCDFHKSGRFPVDLVALSDVAIPHMERAKAMADERQANVKVALHQDYRRLLDMKDLDGVVNATPEHWHAQIGVEAIQAGKDVYGEKPLTLTIEEGFAVKAAVDASKQIFQVGTQKMALSKYRAAREMVKAGKIGKPLWSQTGYCRNTPAGEWNYYAIEPDLKPGVNLDWNMWCGPKGKRPWDPLVYHRWRRYKDFSTGIIGDLLVHEMTPLMYALDSDYPVRVHCAGAHMVDLEMENHDQVLITAQFPDGHTMVVAGNTNNEQSFTNMIRGQKGTIYLGGKDAELRPERPFVDDVEAEKSDLPEVADQDMLRLNWLECIKSREPNFSQVEFATKMMVVVDLATRSAWDGRAWAFDPGTRKIASA